MGEEQVSVHIIKNKRINWLVQNTGYNSHWNEENDGCPNFYIYLWIHASFLSILWQPTTSVISYDFFCIENDFVHQHNGTLYNPSCFIDMNTKKVGA